MAYGRSQARDWILAAAVTYPAAVAMPNPLTRCARPEREPAPEPLQSDFNPLHHSENP